MQAAPLNRTFQRPGFQSRILPVIVITDPSQAVPIAHALLDGGVDAMEITLRHAAGLRAIEKVARHVPQMHVGAGTVTRAEEITLVQSAGARFALSPGMTTQLVQAAVVAQLPFLPGVMTPGEVMTARDFGFSLVKLFPAAQAGGLAMLKALAGPFGDMNFCPTGGVSIDNMGDFLRQPNVVMVGGSWLTPHHLVASRDWSSITRLAKAASETSRLAEPPNQIQA